MIDVLLLTKAALSAAIFFRLFCYDWPKRSQYRLGVTAAAYLIMLCTGATSILLLAGNEAASKIFDTIVYAAILIVTVAARGNLAKILEIRHQ